MSRAITIDVRWDGQATVWLATSEDVPGLVVEAEDWRNMMAEVRLILPELLALESEQGGMLSLIFRRRFDDFQ